MSKLNLSELLLSDSPPPPEVVHDELTKVFSFVAVRQTNGPFFNMQFVCSDDADQVKLIVEYRYRTKTPARPDITERWFYNVISAKDFED